MTTAQVIQFRPREATQPEIKPKEKKPFPFAYELLFIRNLCIWLIVGAVLGLFLPYWLVLTGCILALYFDGKKKSVKPIAT